MKNRWRIDGEAIVWDVTDKSEHIDDIEMTGLGASVVYQYGIGADGTAFYNRHCIWPTLRTKPNDTHASFQWDVTEDDYPKLLLNGRPVSQTPKRFIVNGIVKSELCSADGQLEIQRTVFPSVDEMNIYEIIKVTNVSERKAELSIQGEKEHVVTYTAVRSTVHAEKEKPLPPACVGTKGCYIVKVFCDKTGEFTLEKGQSLCYTLTSSAQIANKSYTLKDPFDELIRRKQRVKDICADTVLDTGDEAIDTMFRFCKFRTGEGVIGTKNGLFHSPGGCRFYASSFCNDQMEYATTWFSYVHDPIAEQSVIDMASQFEGFLYGDNSIPSSVICEGMDYWKLDRGDEAMYAYGLSHYLLAKGSPTLMKRFYHAAEYCLDFCLRRKTEDGIIESAYDELEGRFPSGEANLSTSSLTYAALKNMKYLAKEMGDTQKSTYYAEEEQALRSSINRYFAANMKGFETYQYYDGNDKLRAWICIPLTFGIDERKDGTRQALLSEYLYNGYAFYTQEGNITIWDRSTLYSIRGLFKVGYADDALHCLRAYSEERLLRERTPYAVEAIRSEDGRGWAGESKKSHLSAESCVLCLAVTDGLFGIEGTGLHSFRFYPQLPAVLDHACLKNVHAFGEIFDLQVERNGYQVLVDGRVVAAGPLNETAEVCFD